MREDVLKILDKQYKGLVGDTAYNSNNATIKNITKDYSDKFDTLQVCFLSDMHIGSCDFDIKGLLDTLRYARSQENAVIFMLGDALNTAIIGSKSDPYEDILNPQQQLDVFSDVLKVAKGNSEVAEALKDLNDTGKIVVLHSGNHEDRMRKSVGVSSIKMAADVAGLGDAFAPYYASTDLILRQPLSKDGKFHVRIATHHGTGISNIDGLFRLLRNVDNADMCVIGHTHNQSMKMDRTIRLNDEGKQEYHDVMCLTLPASGGGTYGAGMALPDTAKSSAVWMVLSSQANPYAGKVSPTGISYPEIVPACAFFSPSLKMDTNIKRKRLRDARKSINSAMDEESQKVYEKISEAVDAISDFESYVRDKVQASIAEKPRKAPKDYSQENEKGGM